MDQAIHIVCPECETINRLPETKLTEKPQCGECKKALFPIHPVELNSNNFRKHLENTDLPLVVDFWAPWCGPCKTMGPVFEQACTQLGPQVRFAKLNTENERQIAAEYKILSIPTLIIFEKGQEKVRQSGAMDLERLINWIKANL